MTKPPDTIYMQHDCDGDFSTWCVDRVNDSDVEYTRDGTVHELRAIIMDLRRQLGAALEPE